MCKRILALVAFVAVCISVSFQVSAQERKPYVPPPLIGRWDLVVHGPEGDYPSWLEVTRSGRETLVGRFVAAFGSARPIGQVFYDKGSFRFSLPVQFEDLKEDMWFKGTIEGDRLKGTTLTFYGKEAPFTGVRAPKLDREGEPRWGTEVQLFNGRDFSGWRPRNPTKENGWRVRDGLLANDKPGNDLMTTEKFDDFKLHAEFRIPKDSNSGLYLRGRYEVQIEDSYGREPEEHIMGSVYGFLLPRVNAGKRPGEWQTYDITLVGRRVTVVLNGETILDRQVIPGITGGALDSNEGEPGPLYIQGDHGPIEFRKLTLTPAGR
jgi:hypothetical protein